MSVSVFAPEADLASRRRCSSICNVFFIHTIMPYMYGSMVPSFGVRMMNAMPRSELMGCRSPKQDRVHYGEFVVFKAAMPSAGVTGSAQIACHACQVR